ncbi:alpha/beta hydrolase [Dawidia soli]|uniref:Alpha/beta hydrolase n=1 Tax=Dawidia soli TaxID=2782352 RepID=A0AAP2DFQ0_9BACT|nr:alpha/beta hydrolase [Dawidia soli]MBT1690437.1 alpha/beta hydrolase [Dawidia soli]
MRSPSTLLLFILLVPAGTAVSQSQKSKKYTELDRIAYYTVADADTSRQRLNLVIPKKVQQPPLLIWVGGGAWSYVNPDMEMDLARKIAASGIAVASVGHRLSPATWKDSALNVGIKHPEHIKDLARAMAFLYTRAEQYGFDRDNIFVGGYSSGAHLAALLVMDNRYLKQQGLSKDMVRGVIPVAGMYDVQHYYQVLAEGNGHAFADNHIGSVFGLTPAAFQDASPTTYLDSLATPMLLISETNTFKYTRLFEDRLRAKEYKKFEVVHVHRLTHGQLWKDLSYADKSIYRDLMIDFVRRVSIDPVRQ